eukprot:340522-Prymnesium_polylepis.1
MRHGGHENRHVAQPVNMILESETRLRTHRMRELIRRNFDANTSHAGAHKAELGGQHIARGSS